MESNNRMLPENLPDLTWDDPYYQAALDNWTSVRNTVPDMIQYFHENIESFVKPDQGVAWRMLSIGCGEGLLDLPILNIIGNNFPDLNVTYEGVDPSDSRLKRFQESSELDQRPNHNLSFHRSNFENYPDPINEDNRFDLILCARVLYYMHDSLDSTFFRLVQKLLKSNTGKVIVFHQSPSGLAQIAHLAGISQQSPAHTCNTYHLRSSLDRISSHIPSLHYKIIYLDKYTDMSFLGKVHSNNQVEKEKAINLLSFTLGKNLQSVDTRNIERTVEHILSCVTFEASNNNQHIMFQPIGVILVENRLRRD